MISWDIKYRDGYSNTGRREANQMSQVDDAHSKRVLPDGTLVKKNGDLINVFSGMDTDAGILTVGRTSKGWRIFGSVGGAAFTDRGAAPAQGGFLSSGIGFYGRGMGFVLEQKKRADTSRFDGAACWGSSAEVFSTKDGRSLKSVTKFDYRLPHEVASGTASQEAGHVFGEGQFAMSWHFSALSQDKQLVPMSAYLDQVNGQTRQVQVLNKPGQLCASPEVSTLAPGVLWRMDKFLRNRSQQDIPECDGVVWSLSQDCGQTWAELPVFAPFVEALQKIKQIPASSAQYQDWYRAMFNFFVGLC